MVYYLWVLAVTVILAIFGKYGFIVKTNRSVAYLKGLLLGTYVVSSYRENVSLSEWRERRFNFLLDGPLDVLKLCERERGALRNKVWD